MPKRKITEFFPFLWSLVFENCDVGIALIKKCGINISPGFVDSVISFDSHKEPSGQALLLNFLTCAEHGAVYG